MTLILVAGVAVSFGIGIGYALHSALRELDQ